MFFANSLDGPSGIAIDGLGNVWVPNSSGLNGVSEFANTGSFMGWSNGLSFSMSYPQGVAIDSSGNAWIPNAMNNTITEFSSAAAGGFAFAPGGGLDWPAGIAIDDSGNLWIPNVDGDSLTKVSKTGTAISGSNGYTGGGLGSPVLPCDRRGQQCVGWEFQEREPG
jgi:DNA-binding beta-propeller fold protein YncE